MALKIGADILWEPTACSMPWIYGGFWWLQMYKVWSLCLKKSSSSGPDWLKSKQFINQKQTNKQKDYGEEARRNERFKKKFLKLHNGLQQEKKKAHLTYLGILPRYISMSRYRSRRLRRAKCNSTIWKLCFSFHPCPSSEQESNFSEEKNNSR